MSTQTTGHWTVYVLFIIFMRGDLDLSWSWVGGGFGLFWRITEVLLTASQAKHLFICWTGSGWGSGESILYCRCGQAKSLFMCWKPVLVGDLVNLFCTVDEARKRLCLSVEPVLVGDMVALLCNVDVARPKLCLSVKPVLVCDLVALFREPGKG